MRILVIDDDVTMLWTLCTTLRRWGSKVEAATGARAGIRMLAKGTFDVILLDYRMPDHDALWFMHNAVLPPETTVILTTAYADPRAMTEMRSLGVGHVLEKPFSEAELQERLQKISFDSACQQHAKRKQTGKEKATREEGSVVAHADEHNGRPHLYGAAASFAA